MLVVSHEGTYELERDEVGAPAVERPGPAPAGPEAPPPPSRWSTRRP